jgi:hypothetical protein
MKLIAMPIAFKIKNALLKFLKFWLLEVSLMKMIVSAKPITPSEYSMMCPKYDLALVGLSSGGGPAYTYTYGGGCCPGGVP